MSAGAVDVALAAVPSELGHALLGLTEDQWFDRKSLRIEPRKLAESLVGFANADGGTVAIGLSAGTIEGVDSNPKRVNALMQAPADFTEPTVNVNARLYDCQLADGTPNRLLVIEVPPSRYVHATSKDEAFLRIGGENRRLTFLQRRDLFYDKSQSAFESEPVQTAVTDVDHDLVTTYVETIHATEPIRTLTARGLAVGDRLTVAGLVLFGRHPERDLPSAQIRICRFAGSHRDYGSRQNLLNDVRTEGPIPHIIAAAAQEVRALQPTRRALGPSGRFEQIGLVPETVWLEAIVNAVVHRSYSTQGDQVHVDIYDDRIVIESPGRFPGLADPTQPLEILRFARNPRIARVCTDLGITQELGEGIRRMFQDMHSAGLSDPVYYQTSGSVQLTLSAEMTSRRLVDGLPAMQQRILALLREAEVLSTGEIADEVSASRPTVLRHLAQLQDAGYLDWVGKTPKDPHAAWHIRR